MLIDTLFEDDILLIVNKPSGLLTQSSVDKKRPDLYSILSEKYPYLALHHRLDVGTSGVLLLCKDKSYNRQVGQMFSEHIAQKHYTALSYKLAQRNLPDQWTVENHLALQKVSHKYDDRYASVQSGGDYAKTHFKKIEEKNNLVVIQARPVTGRTHQIRVHLYERGLPILGDGIYTNKKVPPADRLMLHAHQLEFPHPKTQQSMCVVAPLPKDFTKISY